MVQKYETRCWLCGSNDLEPDDRGVKCRSCGATFNVVTEPGSYPVIYVDDIVHKDGQSLKMTSGRPSGTVRRRASKARGY